MTDGTVLILGGRSEIGLAVADRIAAGRTVILAARRADTLTAQRERLLALGATDVVTIEFDADVLDSHAQVLRQAAAPGPLGIVVLAFGILGDQQRAERDAAHAVAVVQTDFVAQVSMLTHCVNLLREQGAGQLVVFGSIAGVRVRRANYVYGSAKAGLDGFASGLADALHGSSIHLLLVRSGFVVGAMTAGMKPAPFASTPDQVADAVVAGLRRRRRVVSVPGFLPAIFLGMRLTPRAIWRRLPR